MCDYSLHNVVVRPARIGERLVTIQFIHGRGFAAVDDPNIAVCMSAGTELEFDRHIECEPATRDASLKRIRRKRARFWQIAARNVETERDALEFRDGLIVPLSNLRLGQTATVRKLPVVSQPKPFAPETPVWETPPLHATNVQRRKH
jgi:hypothetical protein